MRVIGIDHVQLAMPPGGEEEARAFYGGILGLAEIPKPEELAPRGGVWFHCGDRQLHLGVEVEFRPARKAHPALRVEGYAGLVRTLRQAGCEVREDTTLPAINRCFSFDPFGNRIELIEHSRAAPGET